MFKPLMLLTTHFSLSTQHSSIAMNHIFYTEFYFPNPFNTFGKHTNESCNALIE